MAKGQQTKNKITLERRDGMKYAGSAVSNMQRCLWAKLVYVELN